VKKNYIHNIHNDASMRKIYREPVCVTVDVMNKLNPNDLNDYVP